MLKTLTMQKYLYNYWSKRFLSRWIVLLFDVLVVIFSYYLSFFIRFGFNSTRVDGYIEHKYLPYIVGVYLVIFFVKKSFSGIIRLSGLEDTIKIVRSSIYSAAIILLVFVAINFINPELSLIPKGVVVIQSLLISFILVLSRMTVRGVYRLSQEKKTETKNVVIYGAGSAGLITKKTLRNDLKIAYSVCCFVDDNSSLVGKNLDTIPIYSVKKVLYGDFLLEKGVEELIIAINKISTSRKNEIVDVCLKLGIKVKIIPTVEKWINNELSSNQIKEVKIEDLLDRDPIEVDNHYTKQELGGKVILVTGSAGSIGSEIVRQLVAKEPKQIILLDIAESPLHDFRMEIGSKLSKEFPDVEMKFVIGDIRNREGVQKIFNQYKPNIVFHAAAYKHVPLMEEFPEQAVMTNVSGTKNIADAAVKSGTSKFVMVSTDKAVNPTNVMGASKRIAEMYIQSLNKAQNTTNFITTRFGNVLGSNGSVIPLFKKQIEKGGPITVTHKDITRYFMTIPEACQLVLEAGTMGKGGEIFIFDMGESVRIFDLAKKMIQLSGYKYPEQIDITFSGLRPGEKLYEELLASTENTMPTYNSKIMLAKIIESNFVMVSTDIEDLILHADEGGHTVVSKMKSIVPEFISNNSIYEELDQRKKSV